MNSIQHFSKLFLPFLISSCLIGCATPPMNFESKTARKNSRQINAEIKTVNVVVESAENVNGIFQSSVITNWRSSLERGLSEGKYFEDDSKRKIDIKVTAIMNYSGLHFDADVSARYDFINRKDQKTIHSLTIKNKATDSTFAGEQRSIFLTNKVITENVKQFFAKLDDLNLEL